MGVSDSHYKYPSPHGGHMPGTFFAYCGQLQTLVFSYNPDQVFKGQGAIRGPQRYTVEQKASQTAW